MPSAISGLCHHMVQYYLTESCKKAEFRKGSGHRIKVLVDPLVESTPFNSELQTHRNM